MRCCMGLGTLCWRVTVERTADGNWQLASIPTMPRTTTATRLQKMMMIIKIEVMMVATNH